MELSDSDNSYELVWGFEFESIYHFLMTVDQPLFQNSPTLQFGFLKYN